MAAQTNTSTYKMNRTALVVKDPQRSIEFYDKHFGLKPVEKIDFSPLNYSVHLIGYPKKEKTHWTNREGLLEFFHFHGSESDPDFKVANGNSDPGRDNAISVDNIEEFCAKLEADGVKFQKRLTDGRQKNIAFALDPDGYWIELIPLPESRASGTDPSTYQFNHSMIRVKDPEVAMQFYRSVLGMSLIKTLEFPQAGFNLYFLGYRQGNDETEHFVPSQREGLIELTWNYGTEKDPEFKGYHTGHSDPIGFSHVGISVDDLDAAVARFKDLQVPFVKELDNNVPLQPGKTHEKLGNIAFITDPDGYWVEILQNEDIKKRADW